jgi:formylglycine-generating enzyme required for sulfatase activity
MPARRRPHRAALAPVLAVLLGLAGLLDVAPGRAADVPRQRAVGGLPLVSIPSGRYTPLYQSDAKSPAVEVAAFLLMARPVSNEEFLAFVTAHPTYRRDRIARVFADEAYLAHWAAPAELGRDVRPRQPVTRVSWFAAKAFCESRGLRLPTEAEWELAAAASATRRDGREEPGFSQRVLDWYAKPGTALPDVPHGEPNLYGASDLHGVVWEWVLDFNNALAVADSRNQGDAVRDRFCGGAALLAGDRTDYATFMRLAMRSSLQADYTTANMGFRCAASPSAVVGARP